MLAVAQVGMRPWQATFLKWRDQQGNVSSHISAFLVSSLEQPSPLRARMVQSYLRKRIYVTYLNIRAKLFYVGFDITVLKNLMKDLKVS